MYMLTIIRTYMNTVINTFLYKLNVLLLEKTYSKHGLVEKLGVDFSIIRYDGWRSLAFKHNM